MGESETGRMNIIYVYVDNGRFWCWVEGFNGLERSCDPEFGTVEWRYLPTNKEPNLTTRQVEVNYERNGYDQRIGNESDGQEVDSESGKSET